MHTPACIVALACLSLVTASLAQPVGTGPTVPGPVTVPVLTVGKATADLGFELEGTLQAVRQSTVAAQAQGQLLSLNVKAGERVKAGQVLARIDARDASAGLAAADAGVAQAQARLGEANHHLQRQGELQAKGFVAQAVVDSALAQQQAAQAGLAQAQAARAQAGLGREHTAVLAPFDGVVLATHAQAGELAVPGRPVATVYAPGAMRAVVQVPSTRTAQARTAQQWEVAMADGQRLRVRGVQPMAGADPVAQTVEWRLELDSTALAGLPGQAVRVRFMGMAQPQQQARAQGWRLPASAVLQRGELTAVYVATPKGFVLRAVRTGPMLGNELEVLAGLREGDRVAQDAVKAGLSGARPAP